MWKNELANTRQRDRETTISIPSLSFPSIPFITMDSIHLVFHLYRSVWIRSRQGHRWVCCQSKCDEGRQCRANVKPRSTAGESCSLLLSSRLISSPSSSLFPVIDLLSWIDRFVYFRSRLFVCESVVLPWFFQLCDLFDSFLLFFWSGLFWCWVRFAWIDRSGWSSHLLFCGSHPTIRLQASAQHFIFHFRLHFWFFSVHSDHFGGWNFVKI